MDRRGYRPPRRPPSSDLRGCAATGRPAPRDEVFAQHSRSSSVIWYLTEVLAKTSIGPVELRQWPVLPAQQGPASWSRTSRPDLGVRYPARAADAAARHLDPRHRPSSKALKSPVRPHAADDRRRMCALAPRPPALLNLGPDGNCGRRLPQTQLLHRRAGNSRSERRLCAPSEAAITAPRRPGQALWALPLTLEVRALEPPAVRGSQPRDSSPVF